MIVLSVYRNFSMQHTVLTCVQHPSICLLVYNVLTLYKLLIFTLFHVSRSRRNLGRITAASKLYGLQLPRLLSVRFRIYAGFCQVLRFVNDARLRFCKTIGFKWYGLTTVKPRLCTTVKTPGKNAGKILPRFLDGRKCALVTMIGTT